MDSVALVKDSGDLKTSLKEAIDLIGGFKTLRSPLFIKPNISDGVDATGFANTQLDLVEQLIDLILAEDSSLSIRIIESDSEMKYADEAFKKFGFKDLEQRMSNAGFNVSTVNLSEAPTAQFSLDGLYLKNPELPSLLDRDKYFISVAVAKTHSLTLVTGTTKNLFGLLPRKGKSFYHPHITEVIVDLNRLVRPDLCIVDARMGLEGWKGPVTRRMNTLIVGRNPVSVDATMARTMGLEPEQIRHLVEAEKYGSGVLNHTVLGEAIEDVAVQFNLPANLSPNALSS